MREILTKCGTCRRRHKSAARLLRLSALLASCFLGAVAVAHHGTAVEFDVNKNGRIEGVVKEIWFKAPHVRYYVTVVDKQGQPVTWDIQSQSPINLRRLGWSKETLKVGDKVIVEGFLGRDGRKTLYMNKITTTDGKTVKF